MCHMVELAKTSRGRNIHSHIEQVITLTLLLSFDSKFDVSISPKLWYDLEKSGHDFGSTKIRPRFVEIGHDFG